MVTTIHFTPERSSLPVNLDILQGSFRLCNWLSLRRLVSWINHLPPACWSTFRKSNSKQQLGCRFDIMDYESYFFVFWHMQLYMSWYIISFFGFTFLNIFIFSSTLVLTFSYRRNLYTLYYEVSLMIYPHCLTRRGGVTNTCVSKLWHHWFSFWLVACSAPNNYSSPWCLIITWIRMNKCQWNPLKMSLAKSRSFSLDLNGLSYDLAPIRVCYI